MGLPTPIAYLISAIFVAPALVELGFSEIASHLFLFFFAIKSGSTPPIAVVAVVAAGIARANWWKTAWRSFIYSLPGFIIAYGFVFNGGFLLGTKWYEVLKALSCGLAGVAALSFAMQRYLFTPLSFLEFLLLSLGALLTVLMGSGIHVLIGLSFFTITILIQVQKLRARKTTDTGRTEKRGKEVG